MVSGLLENELIQQEWMRLPRDESYYVEDAVKMNPKYNHDNSFDKALLCVHLKQGHIRVGKFMKIDGISYIVVDTNAKSNPSLFEDVSSVLLRKTKY